jgi:hypothetical protein
MQSLVLQVKTIVPLFARPEVRTSLGWESEATFPFGR